MLSTLYNILLETRPLQWVKNLTIFIFLIFSREFFIAHQFWIIFWAFVAFTFLTSSVYIFNDLIDYEVDKNSPEKKNRPIASGKLTKPFAFIVGVLFLLISLIWAFTISQYFFVMCCLYAGLMLSYSLYLKNLVIMDALVIAGGFTIRVLAGAFIIDVSNLYSWVVILVISVSLLLAFGKRRSEITLMGDKSTLQRKVLRKYPIELLNSLISALVASTFLSYILLTFQTDSAPAKDIFQSSFIRLPSSLSRSPHLLKLTIPIVFYGLARYLYIIYAKKYGGTPEKALFSDWPLLTVVIGWLIVVFFILYASISINVPGV